MDSYKNDDMSERVSDRSIDQPVDGTNRTFWMRSVDTSKSETENN